MNTDKIIGIIKVSKCANIAAAYTKVASSPIPANPVQAVATYIPFIFIPPQTLLPHKPKI